MGIYLELGREGMNTTSLKRLLDACFTAKHIIETMPALPKGMKPRHIHVLDSVDEVCREQGECRVGDVSGRDRKSVV